MVCQEGKISIIDATEGEQFTWTGCQGAAFSVGKRPKNLDFLDNCSS